MQVVLLATRECPHLFLLKRCLNEMGVKYTSKLSDENPEYFEKFEVRCSPTIIVDGKVVYRGMPTPLKLRSLMRARAIAQI